MPAENQTSKLGTSSSPKMAQVIDNSKNSQRTFPDNSTATAYNKQPIDVPGAGK